MNLNPQRGWGWKNEPMLQEVRREDEKLGGERGILKSECN